MRRVGLEALLRRAALPRVLVADPCRAVVAVLAELLAGRASVRGVRTAREAVEAGPAELAFVELALPDSSGLELCRSLRDRGQVGRVVLLTAWADLLSAGAVLPGVDAVLAKPFDPEAVLAAVGCGTAERNASRVAGGA